jgi:menaquinone-dependent protoporphyrinogen oxidase
MGKILIAYATMTGSSAEIAQAVAEVMIKEGAQVDVLPFSQIKNLENYTGVIVGAPMIMGWHRKALAFLRRHRRAWQSIPLVVFLTAMSLTRTGETSMNAVPVFLDENLPKPPVRAGSLSWRERYATLSNYLAPILRATRPVKPVSIAVFGGRLEYGRLPWWAVLFAMVIIQAPAGERRNWPAIRAWAADLTSIFQSGE